MRYSEVVRFRVYHMPCCGHMLCWLNPRIPTFCPECGKSVYSDLKTGQATMVDDDRATVTMEMTSKSAFDATKATHGESYAEYESEGYDV